MPELMPVAEPNVTGQLLVLGGPVVADADVPPVDLVPPTDVVPPIVLRVLVVDEPPVGLVVLDESPPRLSVDELLGCPELLQPAAARTRH
jgi:hypothetical protein